MVVERHQYVVVAKVPSGARFLPEHQFAINEVPTTEGPVRLVIRTRWDDIGLEHAVPRELWFDVRGEATSLDAAVAAFSEAARAFGPFVAFVANVEVGLVEVHLAYDATPQLDEHEFMEVFLPDQRGLPTEGRRIDPELLHAFVAALAPHNEWKRLNRALGHLRTCAPVVVPWRRTARAGSPVHCRGESDEERAKSRVPEPESFRGRSCPCGAASGSARARRPGRAGPSSGSPTRHQRVRG